MDERRQRVQREVRLTKRRPILLLGGIQDSRGAYQGISYLELIGRLLIIKGGDKTFSTKGLSARKLTELIKPLPSSSFSARKQGLSLRRLRVESVCACKMPPRALPLP